MKRPFGSVYVCPAVVDADAVPVDLALPVGAGDNPPCPTVGEAVGRKFPAWVGSTAPDGEAPGVPDAATVGVVPSETRVGAAVTVAATVGAVDGTGGEAMLPGRAEPVAAAAIVANTLPPPCAFTLAIAATFVAAGVAVAVGLSLLRVKKKTPPTIASSASNPPLMPTMRPVFFFGGGVNGGGYDDGGDS